MVYSLTALLLFSVWAMGGVWPPTHPIMVVMAGLVWGELILRRKTAKIHRDYVFWICTAFLVLLFVQLMNTGREMWFYPQLMVVDVKPPPVKWLPSSFSPIGGWEMIAFFFPMVTVLMGVRHGLDGKGKVLTLKTLVVSGVIFAVLGIAGRFTAPHHVLWIWEVPDDTFASFGYTNHAGTLMVLYMGICMAIGWWGLIPLFMVGIAFAGCTGAICLGVFMVGIWAIWLICKYHKGDMMWIPLGFTLLLGVFFVIRDNQAIAEKLKHERLWQVEAAQLVHDEHRWVGAGGHAFRNLSYFYTAPERLRDTREQGRGNVHNDFMEFLCEFGLIGMFLLLSAVLLSADRKAYWLLCGCGLVIIHSLVDIPFRCPAILLGWTLAITKEKR